MFHSKKLSSVILLNTLRLKRPLPFTRNRKTEVFVQTYDTHSHLIVGLLNVGQTESAEMIYNIILKEGLGPNSATYTTMISGRLLDTDNR